MDILIMKAKVEAEVRFNHIVRNPTIQHLPLSDRREWAQGFMEQELDAAMRIENMVRGK